MFSPVECVFFADKEYRGDGLSVMWSETSTGTAGGLLVKGHQGTHLRLVQADEANMSTESRTKDSDNQHLSSSWTKPQQRETEGIRETGSVEQKMKRQMQSARRPNQERRMARVEELRELVRTGRYHVDSMSLAQSMLDNETHFIELLQS